SDLGEHGAVPQLQGPEPWLAALVRAAVSGRDRRCGDRGRAAHHARGLRLRLSAVGVRGDAVDADQEAEGSHTVTVVPRPRALSTLMRPPFSSTLRRAIGRPSPAPDALVEK